MFRDGTARRGVVGAVASALLWTTITSVAAAQEPAPTAPSAAESLRAPNLVKQTYSGSILLSDGLALATFAVAVKTESAPLGIAAALGYALGGPGVHLAHRRPQTSFGSLTLRLLVPAVGAGLGAAVFSLRPNRRSPNDEATGDPAVLGAGVGIAAGILVAPILDAAILARREWFEPLRLSLSPHGGGATFGLRGSF